ncbi:MAG: membrane-associated phospholipid phosphatase [Candidatus Paceibacteria bacterium]|jgi:membrane-associated phospholipid phosphatase
MEYLTRLHIDIFREIFEITTISPELNIWIYIVAEQLDWYVILVGVLFIVLHKHGQKINRPVLIPRISLIEGIYTTVGVLIAWGISYVMKISFAVARPFIQFPDIMPLFLYGGEGYNSFPSGHATLFAALSIAIFLHHKKVGLIFILLTLMISSARVIAGVHFPIDVLVGWLLGGLMSWITYKYFIRNNT